MQKRFKNIIAIILRISINYKILLQIPQKWVVALFPESKQYSVIPTNWIVQNDSKIKFCHWPPGEVNSDVIQNANVPDPTWKLYRIKIYGGNKTFGKNK